MKPGPKPKPNKKVRKSIAISPELWAKLTSIAVQEDTSVSRLVEECMAGYVDWIQSEKESVVGE